MKRTAFSNRQVKSTTETSAVGTRNDIPVSLPFNAGITFPTAFAAPVDDGIMFCAAPRPPRQSFANRVISISLSFSVVLFYFVRRSIDRFLCCRIRMNGRH